MYYPSFFDRIEPIALYDPLSDFLGAFEQGNVHISYLECVKLAGHSCPTVAGAFLMAKLGLARLFGKTPPHRGMVHLAMRDKKSHGVTGVTANVMAFILGAGDAGGFKGIQGRFGRDGLVAFDVEMEGEIRLTRIDTEQSIELTYDPSVIPPKPEMKQLMAKMLQETASPEEQTRFKELWQARVEAILTSTDLWEKMITIKEIR